MTIQECYQQLEGNYEEVFGRFRREALVQKFAAKFAKDKSFEELKGYLEADNTEEAFRAAHTLKGVSQNLSFTKLGNASAAITELLRDGKLAEAKEYFPAVADAYRQTTEALAQLS